MVAPDLDNAFEDIQISTIGSDLIKEENAKVYSNVIDKLQSGGVRSVMGAVPKVVSGINDSNKEVRAYLDKQVQDRDYAIAKEDSRLKGIEENRYQQELQGLGQSIEVGNQQMWSGIKGMSSSIMYAARNGVFGGEGDVPQE